MRKRIRSPYPEYISAGGKTYIGDISENVQHRDDPHGGWECDAEGAFRVLYLGEDRIHIIVPLVRKYRVQQSRTDVISVLRSAFKGCFQVEVVRVGDAPMASQSCESSTHDEQ